MPAFFAYLCNDIERVQMRALSVIAQQVHTANIYLDLIYARLKKVALGCVRNSSPPFRILMFVQIFSRTPFQQEHYSDFKSDLL